MTRVDLKMSQVHRIYKDHKVICTLLSLKISTKLKISIKTLDHVVIYTNDFDKYTFKLKYFEEV
jgi:hypothetical protein